MKQRLIAASLGLQIAFVFLAISVFAWGVQAKLSLYDLPTGRQAPIVAKLSSERNASHLKASIQQAPTDPSRWEDTVLPVSASLPPVPTYFFHIREIAADQFAASPLNLRQVDNRHRPPPTIL